MRHRVSSTLLHKLAVLQSLIITAILLASCASGPRIPSSVWMTPVSAPPHEQWFRVSCASALFCVANDGPHDVVAYNGRRWGGPTNIDPAGYPYALTAISCASPSFCAAVDDYGNASTYNGTSWTVSRRFDSLRYGLLTWLSCASSSFCAALDSVGDVFLFTDAAWSKPIPVDRNGTVTSISCTSESFCVIGTTSGAIIYDGTRWIKQHIDAGSVGIDSISCVSTRFCEGVGYMHRQLVAISYNGKGWNRPTTLGPDETADSISCTSPRYCVAVENALGKVFVYRGGSWSEAQTIGPSGVQLGQVSCSSLSFCVVVGMARAGSWWART